MENARLRAGERVVRSQDHSLGLGQVVVVLHELLHDHPCARNLKSATRHGCRRGHVGVDELLRQICRLQSIAVLREESLGLLRCQGTQRIMH